MSGHSKWSTIKRQKQAGDQKRGLLFSKLANAITIAVREGGGTTDPGTNFKLRLVVDRAKAANMPKENIDRAIDRAIGPGASTLEEILYEGYGSGGVAILVEVATDSRARTMQEVKNVFDRSGGTLAAKGSVAYLFTHVGLITAEKGARTSDQLFSIVVESGADDFEEHGDTIEIYTQANKLHEVKEKLTASGMVIVDAELTYRPINSVQIVEREKADKILHFMNTLEELDDVQKVYANFDIHDDIVKSLSQA